MKRLLTILSILLVAAPVVRAQTPTVPPQASAVGYSNLAFDDEFTSNDYTTNQSGTYTTGANWYPNNYIPATGVTINPGTFYAQSGTLTTTAPANPTAAQTATGVMTVVNGCIGSVPTFANPTAQYSALKGSFQHGYFEARIQVNPNTAGSTSAGWPSFWSFGTSWFYNNSVYNSGGPFVSTAENDFMEYYPYNFTQGGVNYKWYGINTVHNWVPPAPTDNSNSNDANLMNSLVGTTTSPQVLISDGNWHTIGCLWVSTGSNTGYIQHYIDNYLVVHPNNVTRILTGVGSGSGSSNGAVTTIGGVTCYETPGAGQTTIENEHMYLILGGVSTSVPINVDWVHVWQGGASTGTTTGTGSTAQTIAGFPSTLSLTTAQSPYTLPSTTSAGLTVSYSVASGPASVSGNTLTLTGAGTVVLNASQAGNSTYAPYSGSETITVTSTSAQSIAGFPSTLSLTTAQSPYSLPATTSAGLTITYSVTSGPATVSGHTLTLNSAGTVVVVATQAGNSTYAPYSGSETITVTSLINQTIAGFPSNLSLTTAQSPYALPATTSAGLTVTYAVVSGPATVSGSSLTLTGAGTVVLSAKQAGNSTYAAYSGTETITVTAPGTQGLSGLPATLTTLQTPYALPATTTVGQTVTYSVASGMATVSGNTLTLTGAGTLVLNASAPGNSSYAAYSGTSTITVTAPPQTVAGLSSNMSLTTAQSPYTLPATSDQGAPMRYIYNSGPASLSGNVLTLTGPGTVSISATQPGTAVYNSWWLDITITVTSSSPSLGAQTVSNFPSTLNLTMAQTPYSLPATTSAGLALTYTIVSGPAVISGDSLRLTGAGVVVLTASQAGNSSYAPYSGSEAITVTTVPQTVSGFPSALSLTTAQSPYTLPATTSGGLALSYSVTGPATVSGNSLTLTGPGTVVVSATQAGNATYAPYSGTETISVSALTAQTVSNFPATQSVSLSSGSVNFAATTSAGQAVTYTVVSGPATISGDTLTITGTGTVVVSATAAGNGTYASYSSTETLTVTAGATLTFTQWEEQPGFFSAAQMANAAISGPTDTPQNDGVPNLLKYVYNINPAVAMTATDYAAMPVTDVDTTTTPGTTYLTLTYRQFAKLTGVTIQVQTSTDLQNWTTVTPSISKQTGTDPNTGDPIILDEVNTNGQASEFIRLNVAQP
jgi:hypothetical protein